MKQKELIRIHKSGSHIQSPGNDSGYFASPMTQKHDNTHQSSQSQADTTSMALSSASLDFLPTNLQLQAESTSPALSTSSSDSLPINHDWDILESEAIQIRAA